MKTKIKLLLLSNLLMVFAFGQNFNDKVLQDMNFRSIGPAGMSGRVTAIDVDLSNKSTIYVGTSAGGLWKSENAGNTFTPIFEHQKTASIGDIAIYQDNPDILYLGTGEGNPRNSQSYGFGMYKSLDGGKSWSHLGLEKTKNIHRVLIHPNNPDVVWVGAIGSAWGPSEDRGVFKTTDGGKTWKKILYTNTTTGVADMVIDPNNPNKLIVAMWEYRRWPWFMNSGGEGSALHMTMDGGDTWTALGTENGLPTGPLGRMGVAIADNAPNIIYANIETGPENAMWRSEDGGFHWKMTTAKGVGDRPFYYSDVAVDPSNENRVYQIATTVSISEDGGKSFRGMIPPFGGVHSDHHAFWIDPDNPSYILDGNDGGLYASHDGGRHWKFHHNIPVGQFYHINVDNEIPYNVYGGMQDNGSWTGPAYKFALLAQITNHDWESVGFGDGFDVIPDPNDSRFGYSTSQGGELARFDRLTGILHNIQPIHPDGTKLRFNWDSGMHIDPHDDKVVYLGSQFVHKSIDSGMSWEIISPDLTTNDPNKQKQAESGGLTIDDSSAENNTTITVIEPSWMEKGVIWVGTDDGNVQITRNGGETWSEVGKHIKGMPKNAWITQIKHSKHKDGEAFVVVDDHRRDNWTPYVFRTQDYGKNWERLVDENDVWGFALSFVQDPIEPNLMFVGTEFGLYFSLNGGENWNQWKKDLPTVAVKDMVIHPREHDLVLGTFGRSIWILDDIRPLRELAKDKSVVEQELHLFTIPDTYLGVLGFPSLHRDADDGFSGKNREYGALLSYFSKDASKPNAVVVNIYDSNGQLIREIKTTAKPGINRVVWNLREKGSNLPGPPDLRAQFLMDGASVFYGTYTVEIVKGEHRVNKSINILKDPRATVDDEVLLGNIARKKQFNQSAERVMGMYKRILDHKKDFDRIKPFISSDSTLKAAYDGLYMKLDELEYKIVPKETKGLLGDTPDLRSQILAVAISYFNPMVEPDQASLLSNKRIDELIEHVNKEIEAIDVEVHTFKQIVNTTGLLKW
ncbi:VPS10 domain-containing protein [Flagellimonas olearia]|uniref:Sortilin N-terminal domain-containing protein n=1 Tax=Flagellimonas olearia TaxID=552546 RepID=A0A444VJY5_9FLAO|nr:hypothetical protein [Allomuricauda olearia]RYC51030.1 hypothetical protein DN53_15440 [Allomuricauda olearia]